MHRYRRSTKQDGTQREHVLVPTVSDADRPRFEPRRHLGGSRLPRLLQASSVALAVVCTAVGPGPTAAYAASPGEAVARLNAQREANGIPGGIVERGDWSRACALHNNYLRTNSLLRTR